jgi:adenine-specific DNA-methyltransferase
MGDLPVFESAMTYVSIFQFSRTRQKSMKYYPVNSIENVFLMNYGKPELIDYNALTEDNWNLKNYKMNAIYKKMESNAVPLGTIGHCNAGLITGCDKILMFSEDDMESLPFEKEILLPVLRADNCSKYFASRPQKYVIYPYYDRNGKTFIYSEKELKEKFPKAYKYLKTNEKELAKRKDSRTTFGEKGNWYGLVRFGRKEMFNQPKIISPGEVQTHKFCLDYSKAGFSCARVFAITVENKNYDIKYVLAILNSEIMKSFIQSIASLKNGGYYQYSSNILNRCPIPYATKEQQKTIINLVNKILFAKKQNSSADTTSFEAEIDENVYDLYGLSNDEKSKIRI